MLQVSATGKAEVRGIPSFFVFYGDDSLGSVTSRRKNLCKASMQHPAWALVVIGLAIAVVGLIWALGPSIPWLGKLPGDIAVEGKNFRFYFPLTTCIVLSALLTGAVWLVRLFSK